MKKPFPPYKPKAPKIPDWTDLEVGGGPYTLKELLALVPSYVDPEKISFSPTDGGCCNGGTGFFIGYPDDERNEIYQRHLEIYQAEMEAWEIENEKYQAELAAFEKEEARKELESLEKRMAELKEKMK